MNWSLLSVKEAAQSELVMTSGTLGESVAAGRRSLVRLFVWDWVVCELLTSVTVSFWVTGEDSSRGSQERGQEPDMTASDKNEGLRKGENGEHSWGP